jgi:hypothetical protein
VQPTREQIDAYRRERLIYSRYRRPGERELDEAFFPVMWRTDGHRTAWLDG